MILELYPWEEFWQVFGNELIDEDEFMFGGI